MCYEPVNHVILGSDLKEKRRKWRFPAAFGAARVVALNAALRRPDVAPKLAGFEPSLHRRVDRIVMTKRQKYRRGYRRNRRRCWRRPAGNRAYRK